MNTDKPILFNPRLSVFIGGWYCSGFFQQPLRAPRHSAIRCHGLISIAGRYHENDVETGSETAEGNQEFNRLSRSLG
jgi:hypothetical protein